MAVKHPPKHSPMPAEPEPVPPKRTGSAKARRTAARLAAVQALYQIDLTGAPAETVIAEFARFRFGHEVDGDRYVTADPDLFADIVRGVATRGDEVDRLLVGVLDARFALDRLELPLRAILRAGAFELLAHGASVPAAIVLNDYVDVAHGFFAGKEPGMVNGVLDRVARTLREAPPPPAP